MRIARVGELGAEKPAVVVGNEAVLVDSLIADWNRTTLEEGALEKVAAATLDHLPRVSLSSTRIGPPIDRPTKVICVGMNYLKHIAETNGATPAEPVIFMKAPDSVIGPNDDIVIPPNSTHTDY